MSEAEILEQATFALDRMWTLAQWYIAISLALVTAAHVAASRINLVTLVAIIVPYTAYFVLVAVAYTWNFHVMNGFFGLSRCRPNHRL